MKKWIFIIIVLLFIIVTAGTVSDKSSYANKSLNDSSVTVIVTNDTVLLRTRFDDDYDLLQHIEVFSEAEIGDNNPFEWKYTWLIPQNNSNNSIASIYSGCKVIHQMGDDACPRRYNSSLMGGNHGLDDMIIITSEDHGKTVEDVGSKWADSDSTEFYIMRIVNDSTLWILSENILTYNMWAFDTSISSDLTHYSGAMHTADITIGSQTTGQLEPVIRDQNKKLFYYNGADSTEITLQDFNVYYGSEVKIFENYNIANPVSSLDSIIAHVGNVSQPDLNLGEPEIMVQNQFAFDKWGGCVVNGYTKNMYDINENGYGFIQGAALRKDNYNNIFYYMPNVTEITDNSSRTWYFETLENFENGPASDLYFSSSYWAENDSLPYRMIQFLGNGRDTLSVGYQMAYDTEYSGARNSVRIDNTACPWRIAATKKTYPSVIDVLADTTVTDTELYVRSFRGYFNPKKYSENASCVQFFKTGEDKYKLFLDYHKSVTYDKVELPEELWGYKIVESDKHDSLTCISDLVTPSGIFVSVNGYGYGVFELEQSVPVTYYVGTNGVDSIGYGLAENTPFKSWYYAIQQARKNPGSLILIEGGIYKTYLPIYQESTFKWGALIENAYNITIKNNPNSGSFPILDCSELNDDSDRYGILIRNSHNITLQNLEIRNVKQYNSNCVAGGIYVYAQTFDYGGSQYPSTELKFENLEIDSIGGSGLCLKGDCANSLVLNCDSHDNCDNLSEDRGDDADGFVYSLGTGEGVVFKGCRSWNNSDDGYDLWGTEVSVLIDSCWAFYNGYDPDNDPDTFYGNGVGFKLGPNTYRDPENIDDYDDNPSSHIVQNCVSFHNNTNGFDSNNSFRKQSWYNNTSFFNMKNYEIHRIYDPGNSFPVQTNDFILRNNLSYIDSIDCSYGFSTTDDENNSWNLAVTVNDSDFVSLDSLGMDGDRDSEGNLPVTDFLKLKYSSDLIDKGVDVGLSYYGSDPDLGCFESNYYIYITDTLLVDEDSTYVIDEGYKLYVDDDLVVKMLDNSTISVGNDANLIFELGGELLIYGSATISGDVDINDSVYVNINDSSRLVIETENIVLSGTDIQLGNHSKLDIVEPGSITKRTLGDDVNGIIEKKVKIDEIKKVQK